MTYNIFMLYSEKRIYVVKQFILIIATVMFAFGVWRIYTHNNVAQALSDFAVTTVLIVASILIHYRPGSYNIVTVVGLILDLGFILFAIENLPHAASSMLWLASFVLLAFLLRSRSEGWYWTALVIGTTLILNYYFMPLRYTNFEIVSFIINLVIVSYFATWYEQMYEEKIIMSEQLNKQLDTLVYERTKALVEANKKALFAQERAQSASRAKSTFLANMSHEIRTPLNAINGFISLLKKDETDTKKRQQMEIIQEASAILTELISDILDLSKIESGHMELHTTDFLAQKFFQSTIDLYQAKASEKNIRIESNLSDTLTDTLVLHSDALRLRQVLNNLFSNAIKFTPDHQQIYFSVDYHDGELRMCVRDTGIGIPEDELEQLFHPFIQTSNNTKSDYGGTGLGMAISLQIAKLMGGDLTVESKQDEGSSFFFTAPISVGTAVSSADEAPKVEVPSQINAHLLIVEDVRANQMYLKMILDRYHITHDIVDDGLKAVEICQNHHYDLILMDENMPKMDGIEAMKAIKKYEAENHHDHTPIIVLTANAIQGDKERLLHAGMDDYLSKPVDADVLLATIVSNLKKYQATPYGLK